MNEIPLLKALEEVLDDELIRIAKEEGDSDFHLELGLQLLENKKYEKAGLEFRKAYLTDHDYNKGRTAKDISEGLYQAGLVIDAAIAWGWYVDYIDHGGFDFMVPSDEDYVKFFNSDKAIPFLERALEIEPDNWGIWYHLGRICKERDVEKAAKAFDKCCEIKPNDWTGFYSLAQIYYKNEQFKEAVDAFEKTIHIERASGETPNRPFIWGIKNELLNSLVEAYKESKQLKRGISFFKKLEEHGKVAGLFIAEGSISDAIAAYEQAEDFPSVARLHEQEGNIEKAIEAYAKSKNFLKAGELSFKKKNYGSAIDYFRKYVGEAPCGKAFLLLGKALEASGELEQAAKTFQTAVDLGSEEAQTNLSKLLQKEVEIEDESSLFQTRSLRIDDSLDILLEKGLESLEKANISERYRFTINFASREFVVMVDNSELYQRNCLDGAKELLSKAVKLDPDSAEAHYHLGDVFWHLSQWGIDSENQKLAIKHLEKAAQLQPDNPQYNSKYQYILSSMKELTPAEQFKHLIKAIRFNNKDANCYLKLGLVYEKFDDIANALQAAKRAQELEPAYETYVEWLETRNKEK